MTQATIAVFVGPSLAVAERPLDPRIAYLPAARRGDVASASEHFRTILLIDGVFHESLATTPKEMFAVTRRCETYGAASMGALRAAECRPYGMHALGAIALWYACERIDGDDEVALVFDPQTERAITVPSVNVRYLARLAMRRGILDQVQGRELVRRSREIFYKERDWFAVLELAPEHARDALGRIVPFADLKRLDALFAIRHVVRRADSLGRLYDFEPSP